MTGDGDDAGDRVLGRLARGGVRYQTMTLFSTQRFSRVPGTKVGVPHPGAVFGVVWPLFQHFWGVSSRKLPMSKNVVKLTDFGTLRRSLGGGGGPGASDFETTLQCASNCTGEE